METSHKRTSANISGFQLCWKLGLRLGLRLGIGSLRVLRALRGEKATRTNRRGQREPAPRSALEIPGKLKLAGPVARPHRYEENGREFVGEFVGHP